MPSPSADAAGTPFIAGLDSLRFVAAAIVALSHGAAPPLSAMVGHGRPAGVTGGACEIVFDGVAAVLVFFVISGLCIHYPYAAGRPFRTAPFYVRRGLRILPPLLAMILIASWLGGSARQSLIVVLWSVYCELIYYAAYPLLRIALRRFGLKRIVFAAFAVSAVTIAAGWRVRYYWGFPIPLTALAAAPAWLLGCLLAERVATGEAPKRPIKVWAWRAAVWAYAAGASVVFFHAPVKVGYPALLTPFCPMAYAWIQAETAHFRTVPAPPALEWAGRWSYSLYLTHNVAISLTPLRAGVISWSWMERLALILGSALAFYAVVEAPSHRLARLASRALDRRLHAPALARAVG